MKRSLAHTSNVKTSDKGFNRFRWIEISPCRVRSVINVYRFPVVIEELENDIMMKVIECQIFEERMNWLLLFIWLLPSIRFYFYRSRVVEQCWWNGGDRAKVNGIWDASYWAIVPLCGGYSDVCWVPFYRGRVPFAFVETLRVKANSNSGDWPIRFVALLRELSHVTQERLNPFLLSWFRWASRYVL